MRLEFNIGDRVVARVNTTVVGTVVYVNEVLSYWGYTVRWDNDEFDSHYWLSQELLPAASQELANAAEV